MRFSFPLFRVSRAPSLTGFLSPTQNHGSLNEKTLVLVWCYFWCSLWQHRAASTLHNLLNYQQLTLSCTVVQTR